MRKVVGLALPDPPGWNMRLIGIFMWQTGEGTMGPVREASSRIQNTQRKVMNEDTFRTDIRVKNIQLPNRWYHYASWKVYPE